MNRQPLVEHIPSLRRYARALTGDAWAADDLVQDTLERACTKWHLWLAGSDLRAWLFTVMHNQFISQVRLAARQGDLAKLQESADRMDELAAPAAPIDSTIDLQRCLSRLPDEQREVLLLVTLEDLSYAQVAKITGVPVGTVMSRLSRARRRLQELMEAPAAESTPATGSAPEPVLRRLK